MRIVLVGPPGAGKGTQAAKLADMLAIPHISTGDLFRHHISHATELGLEAKRYLDAGELVPSHLTNALVDERLNENDAVKGFILDGFPRSVQQAEVLEEMLDARGLTLDHVLEMRIDEGELLTRLVQRGRADDTRDVIINRLKVYYGETAPVLEHYREKLTTIDAVGAVDEVSTRAMHALSR